MESEGRGAAPERSRAGEVVAGRYKLARRIGAGGSSVVYEAENVWTRRRVALKLLSATAGLDSETARRFVQEARVASRLRHPNVVDVLDMGRDEGDGALYIVQELLEGEDLARHLAARGALPLDEALELLVPVLGALGAAHARGVIHRDVKPANIFLARTAAGLAPKLIDFGISKVLDADAMARTRTGALMGTACYMAPEQARGEHDVDARADVWAAGATLYEALAGRRAFDAANPVGVMYRILEGAPEALERAAPGVPTDVAAVVHRALRREREARFDDARALLDALLAAPSVQASERGRTLATRHAASLAPAAEAPQETSDAPERATPAERSREVTLEGAAPADTGRRAAETSGAGPTIGTAPTLEAGAVWDAAKAAGVAKGSSATGAASAASTPGADAADAADATTGASATTSARGRSSARRFVPLAALLALVVAAGGVYVARIRAPGRPAQAPRGASDASPPGVNTVRAPSSNLPLQIQSVVRSQMPHVQTCYDQAIAEHPTLAREPMRAMLQLDVAPDGTAREVRVEGLEREPAMARCVVAQFSGLRFPASDASHGVRVNYPLQFAPAPSPE